MKRVLITGATGFVGANLVRRMISDGHDTHALVRPGYAPWRLQGLGGGLRLHVAALEDAEGVRETVRGIRPEWVFHCAAYGAYSWQTDRRRMVDTNIQGTMNLVETCEREGFEVFVNTGSSSEYGFKNHAPTEREWLEPNSDYAVTKAAATLFCRQVAQRVGGRIVTLRLYSVYGPYEEPTRLVPTMLVYALDRRLPALTNPNTARDFVFVDDAIEAYVRAATAPDEETGAVYNIGSSHQRTLREAVEVVRSLFGIVSEPQWGTMADRSWDTGTWVADSTLARRVLGWEPRVSLSEGLRRTADWIAQDARRRHFYERAVSRAAAT